MRWWLEAIRLGTDTSANPRCDGEILSRTFRIGKRALVKAQHQWRARGICGAGVRHSTRLQIRRPSSPIRWREPSAKQRRAEVIGESGLDVDKFQHRVSLRLTLIQAPRARKKLTRVSGARINPAADADAACAEFPHQMVMLRLRGAASSSDCGSRGRRQVFVGHHLASLKKCLCTIDESSGPRVSRTSTEVSTDNPRRSGLSAGPALEHDLHRDSLHDFDPVAGRVFRRQQRERRAGPHADGVDMTFINVAGIDVGLDLRLLPDANVGELRLFEICDDVEMLQREIRH